MRHPLRLAGLLVISLSGIVLYGWQKRPEPEVGLSFVAITSGQDPRDPDRISKLLKEHGLVPLMWGSGRRLFVQVLEGTEVRAIELLLGEAKTRRIWLYFASTVSDDTWKREWIYQYYEDLVKKPEFAPGTELGEVLRRPSAKRILEPRAYITDIRYQKMHYASTKKASRSIYAITLGRNKDPQSPLSRIVGFQMIDGFPDAHILPR